MNGTAAENRSFGHLSRIVITRSTSCKLVRILVCVSGTAFGVVSEPLVKRIAAVFEMFALYSGRQLKCPPSHAHNFAAFDIDRPSDSRKTNRSPIAERSLPCEASFFTSSFGRQHVLHTDRIERFDDILLPHRPVDHHGRFARKQRRKIRNHRPN